MKFEPVELKENHNVSEGSRLKDMFVLLGGLIAILLIIYFLSGLLVDFIAPHLPESLENSINSLYYKHIKDDDTNQSMKLQNLVDSLVSEQDRDLNYIIYVKDSDQVNAFAVPGGAIVMNSALLEFAETRDEIAFVVAHELGHFQHYDHIKGLGRGLIIGFALSLISANDKTVGGIMNISAGSIEMKFSQKQEYAADKYAVDKLLEMYGNADGAVGFLRKMTEIDKSNRFTAYFSTHPHPIKRVETVVEYLKKME